MAVSARLRAREQAMLEVLSLGRTQTEIIHLAIRLAWIEHGYDFLRAFRTINPERSKELEKAIYPNPEDLNWFEKSHEVS